MTSAFVTRTKYFHAVVYIATCN